jgi:hypothetical protein
MAHARVDELEETAMNENGGRCPLGGSEEQPGIMTFAVDLQFRVVMVRKAPAVVCAQYGDAWIDDPVTGKLENIVAEARRKQALVEVMQWQHMT